MTNWPPPQGEPTPPQWAPPRASPAESWPPPEAAPVAPVWPAPQAGPPHGAWPPPQGSPLPGWAPQPSAASWGAPQKSGSDRALEWVVPINRSGLAIAAGYLGIFGLVLPVLGPFALLFGILAFLDIRRNPEKLGVGRAWFAVIAGGIGTLVLVLLVAVFVLQVASRGV